MNTQEIEKLYIEHAEYFRELLELPRETDAIGSVGDEAICYSVKHAAWFSVKDSMPGTFTMSVCVAVAAMTEAWRANLQKDHDIISGCRKPECPEWIALKKCCEGIHDLALNPQGEWLPFDGEHPYAVFNSLPELICAVVKVLAAEKRAKAKAEYLAKAKMMMGLDLGTGPDSTAESVADPTKPAKEYGCVYRLMDARIPGENHIRQIVREEIAKATGQKAAGK